MQFTSREEFRGFAKLLGVYLNLDEQDREGVESMASIVVDPDATDDEIEAAIETLREGLFPTAPADLEAGWGEDADQESLSTRMDLEEATFARHLERCMVAKGMTQVQLAAAIGVGQPAISMMLSRNCRPQRQTVEKIARALQVPPNELWPGFSPPETARSAFAAGSSGAVRSPTAGRVEYTMSSKVPDQC